MDITLYQKRAAESVTAMTALVKRQFSDETKAKQFMATVYRLVTDPALAVCTPESIKLAAYQAAELGLLPINGQCYFIKYNQKDKDPILQFQLGYRGMISIGQQAGIGSVQTVIVRKGDNFRWWHDENGGHYHYERTVGRSAPMTHVIATCKDLAGHPNWVILTREDVEYYKSRSSAVKSYERLKSQGKWAAETPWQTDYEAMAEKTALRRLFHRVGSISVKFQGAIIRDEYQDKGARVVVDIVAEHGQEVAEAVGADVVEVQQQALPDAQSPDVGLLIAHLEDPALTTSELKTIRANNPKLIGKHEGFTKALDEATKKLEAAAKRVGA